MRSYQVATEDGRVYRRNRRHLRLSAETPRPPLSDPDTDNPEPGLFLPLQAGHLPTEPDVLQAVVEPPPPPTSQGPVCCSRHCCTLDRDVNKECCVYLELLCPLSLELFLWTTLHMAHDKATKKKKTPRRCF